MRNPEALAAALALLQSPRLLRLAQRSTLPKGMIFLLEVAAAEAEAVEDARSITGRSPATLQKAAAFFIEQVLLHDKDDHYRILGASPSMNPRELRRHMALLLRWLHPDVVGGNDARGTLNRSVYVKRVTTAWEAVKTQERRSALDAATKLAPEKPTAGASSSFKRRSGRNDPVAHHRPLSIHRFEQSGFLARLLARLSGGR